MGLGRHGMARDGKYELWQEWPSYSAGARANWPAAALAAGLAARAGRWAGRARWPLGWPCVRAARQLATRGRCPVRPGAS
jgi:hypothetical protein